VIGKRIDSPYISRRSPDWIKLKCTHRQEFVIAGYTDPQGSRTGIGALLLGIHDETGKLRFAGSVGTGFETKTVAALKAKLEPLTIQESPLVERPREARGHWVKPKLVAEISFAEWTKDGRVRHAVFHGLRSDKPATAITKEVPAPATKVAQAGATQRKRGKAAADESVSGVRISNPQRVIDPSTGIKKIDLVNYYLLAAKRMLPHLAKRPVALVRAPSGIQHQLFFQKHADTLKFPHLKQLDPSLDPGHPPMLEIDSFAALIGAAQMNVIELHTWNATSKAIDRPDRMTFDLDPGDSVTWPMMLEAAGLTRTLLDELGLRNFLKTSGGKGLHIVVPLTPRDDWDTVKNFSKAVVEHLANALPSHFVAKSGAKNRVGKIFVDYLRNGRGATTVAAFSARARPGLGVSIPCAWEELGELTSGAQWTVSNAHERLESGEDPWADYKASRQTLTKAKKVLGAH
jgi:bifunctional non-homologous end joining protein LigD